MNYVEILSLTVDCKNDYADTEDQIFIGLNSQCNESVVDELDTNIISTIERESMDIELLIYSKTDSDTLTETFKVCNCKMKHLLEDDINYSFIISNFIKFSATIWNNQKIVSLKKNNPKPKNKKYLKTLNSKILRKIIGTNYSLNLFNTNYAFDNLKKTLTISFQLNIPTDGFMPFSLDLLNYLSGIDTTKKFEYYEEDLSEINIKSIFDERLENYTTEQDKITEPLTNEHKQKIAPLVLYPFQEKCVSWMLGRELNVPTSFSSFSSSLDIDDIKNNTLKYLNDQQIGYISIMNGDYFYNTITKYCVSKSVAKENITNNLTNAFEEYNQNGNIKHGYGILCEDMSLGKTVECISTILLNKFSEDQIKKHGSWQKSTLKENELVLPLVNSTLVVCTDTIVSQWVSSFGEFSESLNYKIYHYKGFKESQDEFKDIPPEEIVKKLHSYDIVITSYSTLVKEVSYIDFAHRKVRGIKKTRENENTNVDYSSYLCKTTFARAIFDEVQSLSPASLSSINKIKRIHTWAVSATPLISNDFEKCLVELRKLLSSLSFMPFNETNFSNISLKNVMDWMLQPLNSSRKMNLDLAFYNPTKLVEELIDSLILRDISRRHSREGVDDQLNIPKQHTHLIPIYLNPIEREKYNQHYYKLLHSYRIDTLDTTRLAVYLKDLLKLCAEGLYIGSFRSNYSNVFGLKFPSEPALEFSNTEVSSMEVILNNMITDNNRTLASLLKKKISYYIDNGRYTLEKLQDFEMGEYFLKTALELIESESTNIEQEEESSELVNRYSLKQALLLLEHSVHFFLGNCYFKLGESCLDQEKKEKFAIKENYEYELAEKARRLVLKSHIDSVHASMNIFSDEKMLEPPSLPVYEVLDLEAVDESFYTKIESIYSSSTPNPLDDGDDLIEQQDTNLEKKKAQRKTNISTYKTKIRPLLEKTNILCALLNKQQDHIKKLYIECVELLKIPILTEEEKQKSINKDDLGHDENKNKKDITEYETGLDVQNKINRNIELINLIISNRKFLLDNNSSITSNKQFIIRHFEADEKEFFLINRHETWYVIHAAFLNLKIINQSGIIKSASNIIEKMNFDDDLKAHSEWSKRMQILSRIFNKKIGYYRSLQTISDKVIDLQYFFNVETIKRLHDNFESITSENDKELNKLISRKKFLESLSNMQNGEEMKCLICYDFIREGSMLGCGHKFCRGCIRLWLDTKQVCALCNQNVSISEIHEFFIDIKPEDYVEEPSTSNGDILSENGKNPTDLLTLNGYTVFPDMKKVEDFYIESLNYGAKVDTLVKLLSYIDMKDDMTSATSSSPLGRQQIIIYSRFADVIPYFAKVLTNQGYKTLAAIDNKTRSDVIAEFKKNKENRILMLTTDSNAGLTLVNASIIVLFDPILENSVEAQTVNRISRIGQKRETMILNLVAMNTVEENIIRYKGDLKNKNLSAQTILKNAAKRESNLVNGKRKRVQMLGGNKQEQQMAMNTLFLEKCLFYDEA